MSGIRAILGALAAVACAAALAACGGDEEGGPIPESAGDQLLAQLEQIETAVNRGDCAAAQVAATGFAEQVNGLEVEGQLRTALVDASVNLEGLTEDPEKCQPTTGATGEGGVEPTTTETVETTTETTETTTDTPTDTTTDKPPGGGGDEAPPPNDPGQGNQGGGGDPGGAGGNSSGGIGSDG